MASPNLDQLAAILRASTVMEQYRRSQEAVGGLGGNVPAPTIEPTPIPGVGQFNTPGSLPTNPGPADPLPTQQPPSDYWTRIDPNMGYINPSVEVNPGGPHPAPSGPNSNSRTFGQHLLGNRLINPFARSHERWQDNAQMNTSNMAGGGTGGAAGASSQPWYSPSYVPPTGIQAAIARGDYTRAYGAEPSSIRSGRDMFMAQIPGNPNRTGTFASEGRFLMDAEGNPTMQGPTYRPQTGQFRQPQGGPAPYASNTEARNTWLMQQPGYQAWMANRRAGATVEPPSAVAKPSAVDQMVANNRRRFGG